MYLKIRKNLTKLKLFSVKKHFPRQPEKLLNEKGKGIFWLLRGLWLVFPQLIFYNSYMDIQSLSVNLSQEKVQEQAAVKVQAMGLDIIKEQAVALNKLLSTVQSVNDPNMGKNINILA